MADSLASARGYPDVSVAIAIANTAIATIRQASAKRPWCDGESSCLVLGITAGWYQGLTADLEFRDFGGGDLTLKPTSIPEGRTGPRSLWSCR